MGNDFTPAKLRTVFAAAVIGILAGGLSTGSASAAGDAAKLEKQEWSFNGVFGTFDRGALKRGYQIYAEVCVGCHSLDYVAYRNLQEIGLDEETVKGIAAEFEVQDGPNDDGEMFMRPARPSDRFVAPFANEKAARASNNGAFPPDLSLMVKARKGGPDYLYALLTRYHEEAPEGHEVAEGMSYNEVFPGNQIAMSPPLDDEAVEYEDGTPETLQQHAKDITTFLT
ncbi:MAG: cytochrome c1, partial [Rhodospirillaceae bacterium]|nr:cytochrome c1 [Rhodospirillaceae bacterium]